MTEATPNQLPTSLKDDDLTWIQVIAFAGDVADQTARFGDMNLRVKAKADADALRFAAKPSESQRHACVCCQP